VSVDVRGPSTLAQTATVQIKNTGASGAALTLAALGARISADTDSVVSLTAIALTDTHGRKTEKDAGAQQLQVALGEVLTLMLEFSGARLDQQEYRDADSAEKFTKAFDVDLAGAVSGNECQKGAGSVPTLRLSFTIYDARLTVIAIPTKLDLGTIPCAARPACLCPRPHPRPSLRAHAHGGAVQCGHGADRELQRVQRARRGADVDDLRLLLRERRPLQA
jgi:hypothetical protein